MDQCLYHQSSASRDGFQSSCHTWWPWGSKSSGRKRECSHLCLVLRPALQVREGSKGSEENKYNVFNTHSFPCFILARGFSWRAGGSALAGLGFTSAENGVTMQGGGEALGVWGDPRRCRRALPALGSVGSPAKNAFAPYRHISYLPSSVRFQNHLF